MKSTTLKAALLGMIDAIDDDAGLSDDEVAAELAAVGIDLAAATRNLNGAIRGLENTERRRQLDRARSARLSSAGRSRLDAVRAMQLPVVQLRARISTLDGRVAHRDLEGQSVEDLESLLADLMDLDAPE